jgi:hypothetical protein
MDNISKIAEIFKNELNALPSSVKWCYLLGLTLIALLLVENNLDLLSTGVGQVVFIVSIVLLILPTPVWYAYFLYKRAKLREKYPLSKMGGGFHIVDEGGILYLVDATNKEIRWIANLITANDLHFALYREKLMTNFYPYPKKPEKAQLKSFKIMEEIRTRGKPGE